MRPVDWNQAVTTDADREARREAMRASPQPGEEIRILGFRCIADPAVPRGCAELRDENGKVLARIENPEEPCKPSKS